MALLKIARLGHPVLRMRASELSEEELALAETQRLIDDMVETMREARGVGLAATQVHQPKRIFVMEVKSANPRYPGHEEVELTVVVNPEIVTYSEETEEDWEGCLSIPELRGRVPRHSSVVLRGLDRKGKPIVIEAKGFAARVIQHEKDHLDGVVFLDRMSDFSTLTYPREFEDFWLDE